MAETLAIIMLVVVGIYLLMATAGIICTWRRHGREGVYRLLDRWCGWTESSVRPGRYTENNRDHWR